MIRLLYNLLLFSALAGLFLACAAPKEPAGLVKPAYFNLEEVLDKQVKLLTEIKAGAKKTQQQGNGQQEIKTVAQINWQRELEILRQAAINRPAWRTEFTPDTSTTPNGNRTITYRRNQGSNAPVEYLEVHFAGNKPFQVNAKIASNNMLFTSGKIINMEFDAGKGQLLRHYSVTGTEKMILSDGLEYTVASEVLL